MLYPWQKRRREKLLAQPFPSAWEEAISANVAAYSHLSAPEARELRRLVRMFIAEKHWEGCGGFELDEATKAIIAAQACMLILELGIEAYAGVQTILVYPSAVVPRQPGSVLGIGSRHPVEDSQPIVGEAWQHGPVLLSWDAALSGGRDDRDGHNVVYHEFAHKLDMIDGDADGVPPLGDAEMHDRWQAVLEREFDQMTELCERGEPTFLDSYATTSRAELFAVATEQFFEQPEEFERHHGTLYALMAEFYRQDPVVRERVRSGRPWRARERRFRDGLLQRSRPGDARGHRGRAIVECLGPWASATGIITLLMLVAGVVFLQWAASENRKSIIPPGHAVIRGSLLDLASAPDERSEGSQESLDGS